MEWMSTGKIELIGEASKVLREGSAGIGKAGDASAVGGSSRDRTGRRRYR